MPFHYEGETPADAALSPSNGGRGEGVGVWVSRLSAADTEIWTHVMDDQYCRRRHHHCHLVLIAEGKRPLVLPAEDAAMDVEHGSGRGARRAT